MKPSLSYKPISRRPWARMAAALLTGAAAMAHAGVMDAFRAHYKIQRGILPLGTTTFELRPTGRRDCYIYTGQANPNSVVQLFIGDVTDRSRFCVDDNTPRPRHFSHHIDGDQNKSYRLDFDWDAHEVVYANEAGKHKTMALPEGTQDPLSIYIAARLALHAAGDAKHLSTTGFAFVDANEIKHFGLDIGPKRTLKTPAGRYDTVRIGRANRDQRELRFWLAPAADWIPVRVEKYQDGATYRMTLTRLSRP